jgi:hypothetical protein
MATLTLILAGLKIVFALIWSVREILFPAIFALIGGLMIYHGGEVTLPAWFVGAGTVAIGIEFFRLNAKLKALGL